jgi:hypothetical protein
MGAQTHTLAWQVQNEGASADQMDAAWNSVSSQLIGQNLWNTKAEGALKTLFPAVGPSARTHARSLSACVHAERACLLSVPVRLSVRAC